MIKWLKTKLWTFIYNAAKAAIEEALDNDSSDMGRQIKRMSRDESAIYALTKIGLNKTYRDRFALMEHCLELIPPTGLVLEFGVWKGASIRHLATHLAPRKIYGFDSFEGLPEDWDCGISKDFFRLTSLPEVPSNVELIKGWFNVTAGDFLKQHPEPMALLHIDSDIYSSAKFIFDTYGSRIIPGTVILFDEYMNYPTWKTGEFKAFAEWFEANGARYQYVGFVPKRREPALESQQVAVQIQEVGAL